MDWKTLLAYISGSVDEELLLRNAYLVAENRILRDQIKGRVQLRDAERLTLSEIGRKLGKKALEEVAHIVKPDTILAWQRKRAAAKFDGSSQRKLPGRPRVDKELENLVVQMAQENRRWGYDRLAGALAHWGYDISDPTVGNINDPRSLHKYGYTSVDPINGTDPSGKFLSLLIKNHLMLIALYLSPNTCRNMLR